MLSEILWYSEGLYTTLCIDFTETQEMVVKIKGTGKNKALTQAKAGIDGNLLGLFMPSLPLIEGESEADYQSFREDCLRAVKPKDAIEVVWLKDFIDYTWEALRLRRMKTTFIQETRREALQTLLCEYMDKADEITGGAWMVAIPLAHDWSSGDEVAVKKVEAILAKHGLDHDAITAKAITDKLATYEHLDKLIASYQPVDEVALH